MIKYLTHTDKFTISILIHIYTSKCQLISLAFKYVYALLNMLIASSVVLINKFCLLISLAFQYMYALLNMLIASSVLLINIFWLGSVPSPVCACAVGCLCVKCCVESTNSFIFIYEDMHAG